MQQKNLQQKNLQHVFAPVQSRPFSLAAEDVKMFADCVCNLRRRSRFALWSSSSIVRQLPFHWTFLLVRQRLCFIECRSPNAPERHFISCTSFPGPSAHGLSDSFFMLTDRTQLHNLFLFPISSCPSSPCSIHPSLSFPSSLHLSTQPSYRSDTYPNPTNSS